MIRSFIGLSALILSSLVLSPPVSAQDSKMYAGVGYAQFSVDGDGVSVDPAALVGTFGWTVNDNLSFEARLGAGIKTDFVKIKSYFGGFIRGSLPVSDSFNLYGVVGYGEGKVEALGVSVSDGDTAFGIGAEFVLGQSSAHHLGLEWARYFEDTDTLSVLWRVKF